MGKRRKDRRSPSDRGVLASQVGSLDLLCEVRPAANDQTLDLPRDILQAVLAKAVQQDGTASSLRLTSRSLAHACGAALVTGTLYLEAPDLHDLPRREFQHWLWQVGVLQRAFPNSTLKLNDMVHTADEVDILQLLNCTELRGVTVSAPLFTPGKRNTHFWRAIATLGRLHGSRLQLDVPEAGAFRMLETEPSLAAHVSQADLGCDPSRAWSAYAGSGLADQVSRLSSLTRLTLPIQGSVLGQAGMLDALRQLSALQSLCCLGSDMQTLLVNSVPRSWSLLTKLELGGAPDWSLLEQQCPQLQALYSVNAIPLCLTALTSLTCEYWEPQDRDSFQCSRLVDLHVQTRAVPDLLPSTLTSLSRTCV